MTVELRDLIAARIRRTDCGHAIGPGHHGCAAACPSCIADAVVRLLSEAPADSEDAVTALPMLGDPAVCTCRPARRPGTIEP